MENGHNGDNFNEQKIRKLVETLAPLRPPLQAVPMTEDPQTARVWWETLRDIGIDHGYRIEHCLHLELDRISFREQDRELCFKLLLFRYRCCGVSSEIDRFAFELLFFVAHFLGEFDCEIDLILEMREFFHSR